MKKTPQHIIDLIIDSRPPYDENESWQDFEDIGLSDAFKKELGEIRVVFNAKTEDYWQDDFKVVWYFKDHDVYIQGVVRSGSHDCGYKIDTWELKEVFPKKIQVTIYE